MTKKATDLRGGQREIRYAPIMELRVEGEDEGAAEGTVRVVGHGAVFDRLSEWLWHPRGEFREQIRKGAFEPALGKSDIRFLLNHDGLPLARNKSGTLKVEEDDIGLSIEAELDLSDPDVQRLVPKLKRGDLSQMSFAFMLPVEGGDEWEETDEGLIRTIVRFEELFDVSPVTYPAYPDTDVAVRRLEQWRGDHPGRVQGGRNLGLAARALVLQAREIAEL